MSKKFKFCTSNSTDHFYIADLTVEGEYAHVTIPGTGTVLEDSYRKTSVAEYIARGSWVIVEDLEVGVVRQVPARDGKGAQVTMTLDDIKDFMRVRLEDGLHVVYTNARCPELSKFVTNGAKQRKLVLADVLEVYSQPEGNSLLLVNASGRLRFKPLDATKLATLQAKVAAAEAALEAAKAALATV